MGPKLTRWLDALRRRVALMVGRAEVTLVSDAPKLQLVQVVALDGEVLSGIERFQEYGFTSVPLPPSTDDGPSAEAVLLSLGGMRQHAVVVAVDDRRWRPKGLDPGDVCIYTDLDFLDPGQPGAPAGTDQDSTLPHRVTLKRNREIHLEAGASRIVMTPTGISIVSASLTHNGTNIGDDHTHGDTQPGSGSTGEPN